MSSMVSTRVKVSWASEMSARSKAMPPSKKVSAFLPMYSQVSMVVSTTLLKVGLLVYSRLKRCLIESNE